MSDERLRFPFPNEPTAAQRELERQQNEGARIADDCFCPGCGARGHLALCSRCSTPERSFR